MKTNVTCGCDSPLIKYEGSWTAQVSNNTDPTVRMTSTANGDSASLSFTGTSIWIYPGSENPHTSIEVVLDGTSTRIDATMGDIDPTQPLFRKMDLLPITHSLAVRNTATNNSHATTSLDLLKFQWEEKDRYGNTPNMDVSRDDDDSNSFSWHPFDMWMAKTHVVEETSPQLDYNDTIRTHTANSSDAWVQYDFSASTVSIYGDVGPSQGPYSVQVSYVDDSESDDYFNLPGEQRFDASFPILRSKVLLYHLNNIDSNRRSSLVMRNHPEKPGDSLSIDHSVLFSYDTIHDSPKGRRFPVGALVGSIVGPIALICFFVAILYLLRRRRQDKLIRRQKTNMFRDVLVKRGILNNDRQVADTASVKGDSPAEPFPYAIRSTTIYKPSQP